MKPLSDPIWHSRIQLLWIILAAVYAAVAKSYPSREISSVLIVVAGILLVALLGHVLFQSNAGKTRSALLVAFGSSVFLATKSYPDLDDPLAATFAVAFAVMTGSLVFFSLEGRVSQRLRYRYFVAIIFTLVAGSVGFVLTLLEKAILERTVGKAGYYVMGIQGIAAAACFAIGLISGPTLLPATLPHNRPRKKWRMAVALPVGAFFPAAALMALYWDRMFEFFGSRASTVAFVLVEAIGMVVIPVLLLSRFGRRAAFPWARGFIRTLLLAAFGTALTTAAAVEVARPAPAAASWLIRAGVVESPAYITVYGSALVGIVLARRGVSSARRNAKSTGRARRLGA